VYVTSELLTMTWEKLDDDIATTSRARAERFGFMRV
jgi:hypothetical protein